MRNLLCGIGLAITFAIGAFAGWHAKPTCKGGGVVVRTDTVIVHDTIVPKSPGSFGGYRTVLDSFVFYVVPVHTPEDTIFDTTRIVDTLRPVLRIGVRNFPFVRSIVYDAATQQMTVRYMPYRHTFGLYAMVSHRKQTAIGFDATLWHRSGFYGFTRIIYDGHTKFYVGVGYRW